MRAATLRLRFRPHGLARCWFLAAFATAWLAQTGWGAAPTVTGYVSQSWETDDGLPHNVVERVAQDRVGYLWVATEAGLARFDGRDFRVYAVPGGSETHRRNVRDFTLLPDGRVLFLPATGGVMQVRNGVVSVHPISHVRFDGPLLQIHAEPGGAIWLEVGQGLARWDHGHVERFGAAQGIDRRSLHFSWATDAGGRTWIAGADFVGYYDAGRLVRLKVPAGVVYRIAPARHGGPWVYGDALFRLEHGRLVKVAGPGWPPSRASVRCLFEDSSGMLWLGTSDAGLFRFDGKSYQSVPGVERGIESVTEDREGDIWLGTDGGGLRRLRPKSSTFVGLPVTSVAAGADGTLWFAGGLNGVIRRRGRAVSPFPVTFAGVRENVIAVCTDARQRVWLGTSGGVFRLDPADPAHAVRIDGAIRGVHVLFAARNGDVWADGTERFGVYRHGRFISRRHELARGEKVTAMAQGPAGPVWLGTSHGTLYSSRGDRLVRAGLPGARWGAIHALLAEPSGALWIGAAEGLVWYAHGRARRITPAEGLPDPVVLQLLEDPADLWVATPRGLFRIARADLAALLAGTRARVTPVAYGPDQGLSGISPIANEIPAACAAGGGNLWFCTYKGAVGIATERVQHDPVPPPVLIQEVRIDHHVVPVPRRLRVPPGPRRLEFQFAALSFAAPERVELRHELEGFDTDWIDTAPDRIARYDKLPPGNYRLRVIASNGEGVWNKAGAGLAITVLPAWWQTAWFRLAAVFAFAALIAGGARYWSHRKLKERLERLEREHALEQERARIARDMHDELGGTVTGINLTVQRLRDAAGAGGGGLVDVLDRRVRRLSVELDRVVWTVSPNHGSLDQLATYLERFARNLLADSPVRCRVHGRETIPARPVSPEIQHHVLAAVKEAVNNVLKHARATAVVIELGYVDGTLTVVIRDDGAGFDAAAQEYSDRNGLRNLQSRMEEMGASFALRSAPGAGTAVTLRVPLA